MPNPPPYLLMVLVFQDERHRIYAFPCPGCNVDHTVAISAGREWIYNDDPYRPTITLSLLAETHYKCHLFMTDGALHYLPESTHALAGQVVPMQPCDGIAPYVPNTSD